jgi:hypothetical protein
MYSGVPMSWPLLGLKRAIRERLLNRLGYAEVDHLRHHLAVDLGDQDVGVLDVAVNDPLAVGVLDRVAHDDEQIQAAADV